MGHYAIVTIFWKDVINSYPCLIFWCRYFMLMMDSIKTLLNKQGYNPTILYRDKGLKRSFLVIKKEPSQMSLLSNILNNEEIITV